MSLSRRGSFSGHSSDEAPVSLISPGECFTIQCSSQKLRQHLTDSYWCSAMDEICDGRSVGVAVRYTGDDLVMMQFRTNKHSPAGYRYPVSMTIPRQFLVPVKLRRTSSESPASVTPASPLDCHGQGQGFASPFNAQPQCASTLTPSQSPFCAEFGSYANATFIPVKGDAAAFTSPTNKSTQASQSETPHLCVVCGRFDGPGQVRKHGFKCKECIGQKSNSRLRDESVRLMKDDMSNLQKRTMELY